MKLTGLKKGSHTLKLISVMTLLVSMTLMLSSCKSSTNSLRQKPVRHEFGSAGQQPTQVWQAYDWHIEATSE